MKFLRSVAGYSLLDKKCSDGIRELRIFKIMYKVNNYKLARSREKNGSRQIPKRIVQYRPGMANIVPAESQLTYGKNLREPHVLGIKVTHS